MLPDESYQKTTYLRATWTPYPGLWQHFGGILEFMLPAENYLNTANLRATWTP
jgi:hypothetical protein